MPVEHKRLLIKDLIIPEVRITSVFADDLRQQLEGSIKDTGQLMEIIVYDTVEGLIVADGKNRIQALKEAGEIEVDCAVHKGNRLDAMLSNIVTARTKGGVRASEMVKVIEHMVNVEEMDSDEIQRRTGFTRSYIEQIWRIAEASPELIDDLDRELIGVGVAYELSRLPNHSQQEEVLGTVHAFKMTVRQARDLVDDVLKMMSEPTPAPVVTTTTYEPPPPPSCEICHEPNDMLVAVTLDPKCYGALAHLQKDVSARESPPVDIEKAAEGG